MWHKTWAILAMAALALWTPPAAADEFQHSSGYSFTYPKGWFAVGNPRGLFNSKQFPPEIQEWLRKNNVALSRVSMVLLHQNSGDFMANVNVVVENQQMPMDDDTVKKLLQMLPQQYRSMGATIEDPEARLRKFGANQAIQVQYRMKFPGIATVVQQRQVFIPGGGNTYIVTFSAEADSFSDHSQTFDAIATSFKAPTSRQGSSHVLVMAIVGGGVGALVYLVKKLQGI